MKILIIEDEPIAAQRMQMMLKQYDASIEVVGCTESIEDSISWLLQNPTPDLLLLDIQLTDGFSFEIFKQIDYKKPVIFTTAYNEYALEAFRYLSIDYLLKPVTFHALKNAIEKYKLITNQPQVNYNDFFKAIKKNHPEQYKERFLARIGQRLIFVKTTDIAYFIAEDKIVFLVDKMANKLPVDYTLEKLETVLDAKLFFRLNRKIIIAIESIAQIKPYTNSRLILYLKHGQKSEEFIISRERVPEFRQWAEQ